MAQLAKVIERDAFLAGRLIARSNSASQQPRGGRIEGIPAAIVRLGVNEVRDIVVAESVRQTVFAGPHRQLMEEYWRFSLAAAAGCREVARAAHLSADGAFLIGLLHDVGRPLLLTILESLVREYQGRLALEDALEAVSDELSAAVGGLMLSRWRLPDRVVELVREACEERPLTQRSRSQAVLAMGRWLAQQHIAGVSWEDLAQCPAALPVPSPLDLDDLARQRLLLAYPREVAAMLY